jgi:hypothetical protein
MKKSEHSGYLLYVQEKYRLLSFHLIGIIFQLLFFSRAGQQNEVKEPFKI